MSDPQIKAMEVITKALDGLDEEARRHVLVYVGARYGVPMPGATGRRAGGGAGTGAAPTPEVDGNAEFEDFATLYDAASPSDQTQRALVAGYWTQVCEGEANFGAQTLNTNLKNLGHGVKNITQALSGLMKGSPRYVMQVKKTGKTQQARKLYKLTAAGIKRVQELIANGS